MKILKIFLISFFICVVFVFVGALVFIKTFDVNKYKPQIIKQAQKALRRNVSMGHISLDLSLDKGISLNVKDFTVADDSLFSSENFLRVKEIQLGVDILAFLARREIVISKVDVRRPQVVLIRNKEGVVNVLTIAKKPGSSAEPSDLPSAEAQNPSIKPEQDTAPSHLPPVFIQSLQLDDGTIIYNDLTSEPPVSVEISQVQFTVKDFSLTDPFDFSLKAALFSAAKNIDIKGSAQINLDTASVTLSDIRFKSDLSNISLSKLEDSLPMIKTAGIQEIGGDLDIEADKAVVGPSGLTKLSLEGELKNGRKRLVQLPIPITDITVNFTMTEKEARIRESSFRLGKGNVRFEGFVDDYLKAREFHLEAKTDGLELAEIIPQEDQPVRLSGKLADELTIEGKDFTPQTLNNLTGKSNITVKEGRLKNINILKVVLSKVSMIPNLVEDVEQNLPEKYKEQMNDKDTSFNRIDFKTVVRDGALYVDEGIVETDAFSLLGRGEIGFDSTLSLDAHIVVQQDLSESMAKSAPLLQYILDEQGRIFIPVTVSGKIPNLIFFPDLNYLTKRMYETQGKAELEKVLDKVFGREEDPGAQPAPPAPGEPQPEQQPPQKSSEQELIEGILDSIFNKKD